MVKAIIFEKPRILLSEVLFLKSFSRVLSAIVLLACFHLCPLQNTEIIFAENDGEITGYENVTLWIYPEYDDPRLLVMLEGEITGTDFPAEVTFLVPQPAQMYSAGSIDAQGVYSGGPPDRKPSSISGWDEISYEVTTDTFRVEYYDPIIPGSAEKTIDIEFLSLYTITNIEVIIQEPRKSSEFTVSPSGSPFRDAEGFDSHHYSLSQLPAGEPLQFEVSYYRTETLPSLQVNEDDGSDIIISVVIGLVIVAVIGGGLLWLKKTGNKPDNRAARRRAGKRGVVPEVKKAENKSGSPKYCRHCGQPLKGSGAFCAYCGEPTARD